MKVLGNFLCAVAIGMVALAGAIFPIGHARGDAVRRRTP